MCIPPQGTPQSVGSWCCDPSPDQEPHYDQNSGGQVVPPGAVATQCYATGGFSGRVFRDTVTLPGATAMNNFQFIVMEKNLCGGDTFYAKTIGPHEYAMVAIMGMGYPYRLTPPANQAATLPQLKKFGFDQDFSLFLCPGCIVKGAEGQGHGADDGMGMGTLEFGPLAELKWASPGLMRGPFKYTQHGYGGASAVGAMYYTIDITGVKITSGVMGTEYSSNQHLPRPNNGAYMVDSGAAGPFYLVSDALEVIRRGLQSFSPTDYAKLAPLTQYQCIKESDLSRPLYQFPILEFSVRGIGDRVVHLRICPNVYLRSEECYDSPGGQIRINIKDAGSNPYPLLTDVFVSNFYTLFAPSVQQVGFAYPSAEGRQQRCGCVYGFRRGSSCVCYDGASGQSCAELTQEAAPFYAACTASPLLPREPTDDDNMWTGPNWWRTLLLVIGCLLVAGALSYFVWWLVQSEHVLNSPLSQPLIDAEGNPMNKPSEHSDMDGNGAAEGVQGTSVGLAEVGPGEEHFQSIDQEYAAAGAPTGVGQGDLL